MIDRVPSGTTVTVAYYCQFLQKLRHKMHANRPDLLENGVLILHDNAWPRIGKVVYELLERHSWEVLPHPPYSPDMSPPEFDLFPKLKINMRGVRFSMLEDLSSSVTRCVRQLNCSTDLTGIMDLPKRWDAVIRQKEDYTEGLLTLSHTSGVLFCRYCVLCISFEITLVNFVTQSVWELLGMPLYMLQRTLLHTFSLLFVSVVLHSDDLMHLATTAEIGGKVLKLNNFIHMHTSCNSASDCKDWRAVASSHVYVNDNPSCHL